MEAELVSQDLGGCVVELRHVHPHEAVIAASEVVQVVDAVLRHT